MTKAKFIWLGSRQQIPRRDLAILAAEFPSYSFSTTFHDLSILLDQELIFAPHLHRLTRDCYYQLRQLHPVAHSLTPIAISTLVHSFVTVGLAYCSSLYSVLPTVLLACIDRVLCSAARVIGRISKFDHVSSYILEDLRWVPVGQRIAYRVGSPFWRGDASWA